MDRTGTLLALALCVWGWWLPGAGARGAQTSVTAQQVAGPVELVQQLGDSRFTVRKRAMEQLVELGAAAIGALEQGVQSPDREVRFRSRYALDVVREHDFQRRLRAFAAGQDAQETYELPGWVLFRKEIGDGLEARRLFVEMQEAEPRLWQALERSSTAAVEAMIDRLEELQQEPRPGQRLPAVSLGTVATLLFVSNQDRGETAGLTLQNLAGFFRQDGFAAAMQSGSQREILRKMLGTWIENARSWDAFHAMLLAMQFDLPQGLAPAKRMLECEATDPNQAVYRGFALQTIARFGDQSHIPIVEPLLDDGTPYGGTLAISGKAKYQTQIRDIALAALVHLAKQDPKKFGLARLRLSSTQVFNTNSVAFEDDAKREEAIKKWRAFRAENR